MASGAAGPSTKPHFFKPLLPGFLHEFLIPAAFFTKYLGGDPDLEDQCQVGVLRSSSGKPFPVTIKGRRLEAGWSEFATEHELHVGDFVVFGHEGSLVFDVRVYDLSACQRLYPRSGDSGGQAGRQSQPIVVEDDLDSEPVGMRDVGVSERETEKPAGINQPKAGATSFPSHTKHPTFSHVLTRANIEMAVLSLPHQFAEENGLSKRSCEMTLRDEVGRTWPVQLRHRLHNHLLHKSGHTSYIGGGLRKLVIANGLKTGDRIRFELIKEGAKPAANVYVGQQPIDHFISSVKPYSLKRGRFTIPMEFARAHNLVENACAVTLENQEGCSWPVTLHRAKSSGRFYLLNGWLKFALDNHIKVGDSVRFELVKKGLNPVMNFSGKLIPCFVVKPLWMNK